MATNTFTRIVVNEMQRLYPEELADRTWDNVGLLLDNVAVPGGAARHRVLLTNDLTPDVVDEAIEYGASVIVSYHPIIFRGLKAITLHDVQQASLLRLARSNIAVYSPHTALDAGGGGINDWLADAVAAAGLALQCEKTSVSAVKPVAGPLHNSYDPRDAAGKELVVGYGRRVELRRAVPAAELIRRFVQELGIAQRHVLVARPRPAEAIRANFGLDRIAGVAVCAGSGFDVLRGVLGSGVNMLITGEVSHHDALHVAARGAWLVCLLHSTSERGFLSARLQGQLGKAIVKNAGYEQATVLVSERDRDPFEIWDLDDPPKTEVDDRPGRFSI